MQQTALVLRPAIRLLFAVIMLMPSILNAKETNRFTQADNSYLNIMAETSGFDYAVPIMIVVADEDIAFQWNFKSSSKIEGISVSINDGRITSDNKSVIFIPYNFKEKSGVYETLIETENLSYLKTTTSAISIDDNDGSTFTIVPIEGSNDFYIYARYKTLKTDYYLGYVSDNNRFKILSDDSPTPYRIFVYEYVMFPESEIKLSDDKKSINITAESERSDIYLKYILNNGDSVSYNDLFDTGRSAVMSKDKANPGFYNVSLPNYDEEATTLWLVPTNSDGAPTGTMYSRVYSGPTTSLIESIGEEIVSKGEYYNLQGVKVTEPNSPGIYLYKCGKTVKKIVM